jgi:hypothetical protein
MDIQLNKDVLNSLLLIRDKRREDLSKEDALVFKAAYKDITGRYPQSTCGGNLCRQIFVIVHNYLAKLDKAPSKAVITQKVVKYNMASKPLPELKALAKDKGIEFPRNAGHAKMVEILEASGV